MSGRADRFFPSGPYETERQARADVAGVYEQSRRSVRPGALAEANHALLREACERADLVLGVFDARIVAWLAGWEPATCAVVVRLIARAYVAGRSAPGVVATLLDLECQAGRYAGCPGRLCQCLESQGERRGDQ
jgi:hypothetical protein